jgi:hypothetical protein
MGQARVILMCMIEFNGPSGVRSTSRGETTPSVSSMQRCRRAARNARVYSKVCAANKSVMSFPGVRGFTHAAISSRARAGFLRGGMTLPIVALEASWEFDVMDLRSLLNREERTYCRNRGELLNQSFRMEVSSSAGATP